MSTETAARKEEAAEEFGGEQTEPGHDCCLHAGNGTPDLNVTRKFVFGRGSSESNVEIQTSHCQHR